MSHSFSFAQSTAPSGWLIFDNVDFSIQYPGDWDSGDASQTGLIFSAFSKVKSNKDKFRENVNIVTEDLFGKNFDLDKYASVSEAQIEKMIEKGKLIESKRITLNGISFQKMIYTGKSSDIKMKFVAYFCVEKSRAIVLTLTCEESEFSDYSETGEQIISSFKLK
ncbi:MAG: hypothetical protein A2275_10350 [Bacteroidetes bacterium RIFOXYA12_FULL_35_11]|nr:MAG: hypothetical protein A2X01_10510 [Bacteroidetes bacterium GWF2_35_48]OFY74691.1 MAG: hypothetical protein A2275_10350 [Bacteroidetes bacterium RIFOXYA12_FULL_35_11]OFY97887.1 MAG: hypothetical protein A2491_15175 [Bacteroidetes bacterium RIFOXYC12_FULL_35_7]HBX49919.1 hypothetical protein [Bacteroidales bacterium]